MKTPSIYQTQNLIIIEKGLDNMKLYNYSQAGRRKDRVSLSLFIISYCKQIGICTLVHGVRCLFLCYQQKSSKQQHRRMPWTSLRNC